MYAPSNLNKGNLSQLRESRAYPVALGFLTRLKSYLEFCRAVLGRTMATVQDELKNWSPLSLHQKRPQEKEWEGGSPCPNP